MYVKCYSELLHTTAVFCEILGCTRCYTAEHYATKHVLFVQHFSTPFSTPHFHIPWIRLTSPNMATGCRQTHRHVKNGSKDLFM